MEAYKGGQMHFGENYVDELIKKSKEVNSLCSVDARGC